MLLGMVLLRSVFVLSKNVSWEGNCAGALNVEAVN